jgi:tetrahydromethanopterin S-methyltransferase subunit E
MFVISPFFIIPFFIAAAAISGWQLVRMGRDNPLTGMQFWLIIFCIVMMLVVNLTERKGGHPWLSLVFFLLAVATLSFVIRQNRLVPPRRRIE